MNEIDTEIRHTTKSGSNLFAELGFPPEEAETYLAESEQGIRESRALKETLMNEIAEWIKTNHLRQADAAQLLMVSRPRVSDIVNKKTGKFTLDALVEMLARIGKHVRMAVV